MRVACVGGGPGGVFFAALVKEISPEQEVVVFERNKADDTFGFGVVFSDATLSNLGDADPVLRERLSRTGQMWDTIEVRLKGETLRCGGNGMAAISRKELLKLLYIRAAEVGVELQFQTTIETLDQLSDFDLVVLSDGANSIFRSELAGSFLPKVETAGAKFIWFGTTYRFDGLTFFFEESPFGLFAVHGYPIDSSTGTFIVETDEQTWLAAGMDRFDTSQPPGQSDMFSKEFLQSLFSSQTQGAELLVNNSRWANFRTIRNRSWHNSKCVLLGDSAHTAHFSVGSGTKMAMEDAAMLAVCVTHMPDSLEEALAKYEHERRPGVEGIQASAGPSLSWWENFSKYYASMEPQQFVYHFLTRAISGSRVGRRDPEFVEGVLRWWTGKFGAKPLNSPFALEEISAVSRLVGIRDQAEDSTEAIFVTPDGLVSMKLYFSPRNDNEKGFGAMIEIPDSSDGFEKARSRLHELLVFEPVLVGIRGGTAFQRTLLGEECRISRATATLIVNEVFDPDIALTAVLSGRTDFVGIPVAAAAELHTLMAAIA